jgi:hypothetical protein
MIREKRKERDENVQISLREKYWKKENANRIFGSIKKNSNDEFDTEAWKKSDEIDLKIKECR